MPIYDRRSPSEYDIVDRWDGGIGWLAHPDETGRRTSHAVVGADGGVWVIDPLDAPGIDEELSALGDVRGVLVCSNYHVRDADRFAARHDVPVYCPSWLSRATSSMLRSIPEQIRLVLPGSSCVAAARFRAGPKRLRTVNPTRRSTFPTYSGLHHYSQSVRSGSGCTSCVDSFLREPCSMASPQTGSSSDTELASSRTLRLLLRRRSRAHADGCPRHSARTDGDNSEHSQRPLKTEHNSILLGENSQYKP